MHLAAIDHSVNECHFKIWTHQSDVLMKIQKYFDARALLPSCDVLVYSVCLRRAACGPCTADVSEKEAAGWGGDDPRRMGRPRSTDWLVRVIPKRVSRCKTLPESFT